MMSSVHQEGKKYQNKQEMEPLVHQQCKKYQGTGNDIISAQTGEERQGYKQAMEPSVQEQ